MDYLYLGAWYVGDLLNHRAVYLTLKLNLRYMLVLVMLGASTMQLLQRWTPPLVANLYPVLLAIAVLALYLRAIAR